MSQMLSVKPQKWSRNLKLWLEETGIWNVVYFGLSVSVFGCVYLCVPCLQSCRVQKRMWYPQTLYFQTVVSCYVGSGIQMPVPCKSSNCFNHWTIAPASYGNCKKHCVKILMNKLIIIDHKVKKRHTRCVPGH